MKKILYLLIFLIVVSTNVDIVINANTDSSDSSEIERSLMDVQDYKFNEKNINYDNLYSSLFLIGDLNSVLSVEYVYNIYGEVQYLLVEIVD